jgi:lipid-binding SYLF domain-containing protein
MVELCNGWHNAEDGRKDKQAGMCFDRNRLRVHEMRHLAASLLVRPLLAGLLGLSMAQALASDKQEANRIGAEAIPTFEAFVADPHMERFRNQVVNAKAILIIPMLGKVGLIFGGAGGVGLLHDEQTNTWSPPAFYTLASLSVGLQAGGEVAQVVLVEMTHKGRYALLRNKSQVGADVSVAEGPQGAGAQAPRTSCSSPEAWVSTAV